MASHFTTFSTFPLEILNLVSLSVEILFLWQNYGCEQKSSLKWSSFMIRYTLEKRKWNTQL
jgi:hypothetical protein